MSPKSFFIWFFVFSFTVIFLLRLFFRLLDYIGERATEEVQQRSLAKEKERQKGLLAKYNDADLVQRIMKKDVWQGQTAEQLTDALGPPETVEQKVLKTKRTEIWKYNRQGARSFRLRVKLENGVVIGWESR
jgi:hypothetical protein